MSAVVRPGRPRPFELFGEMGMASLLVLVASLPVVTWVAALAAGVAHMRRDLAGFGAGTRDYVALLRDAVRGGWAAGLGSAGLFALLAVNTRLLAAGGVPGGTPALVVSVLVAGLAWVACVRAASAWSSPEGEVVPVTARGWVALVRDGVRTSLADLPGTLLLLISLAVSLLLVWMFLPMFVLAPGLWVLAAVGVEFRRVSRAASG